MKYFWVEYSLLALVTGATGFVGSHLVAALRTRGVRVRVLHRGQPPFPALAGIDCEYVAGDILGSPDVLTKAMTGCNWVFHLAAVVRYWLDSKSDVLYRVNVEGTRNVMDAALKAGVDRVVFTSSLAALGLPTPGALLTEDNQFNLAPARFPYGHSKYLAELEVRRATEKGLRAVTVNPCIVIGPGELNPNASSLILEAAAGRLWVAPPGGGNFVGVEDVAAGHIVAAERGAVGERYILAGENLRYQTAMATICALVGRPGPRVILPKICVPAVAAGVALARSMGYRPLQLDPNQVRLSAVNIFADGRKAIERLKMPQTPFSTLVTRTYNWYRHNGYLTPKGVPT